MLQKAATARPASLRVRKKQATMRRIQGCALELFADRGFDSVTIEEIGEAAEVSPSTIYRYFGTKEGVVLQDEYDEWLMVEVSDLFREHDVLGAFDIALAAIAPAHLVDDVERVRARIGLSVHVPSVRAAALKLCDDMSRELGSVLHEVRPEGRSLMQCRAAVAAVLFPCLIAFEEWYVADSSEPIVPLLRELFAVLGPHA